MTPSQIQRALAVAIARELPPMMDALAERILRELRQQPALPAELPPAEVPAEAEPPVAQEAWAIGAGAGRRLTDAGRARLKELAAQGLLPGAIARELGVSRGSVVLRLGDEQRPAEPATARVERDLARAEKLRAYQRERVRKARAAKHRAPAPQPEAKTVVVVPAHQVPAPRIPPPPSTLVMARHVPAVAARLAQSAPVPAKPQHAPNPALPMDPAQLEPVPASYEDALDWLFAHLVREGLNTAEIEGRLAQLSTKQLLATCNAQRIKAGLSPYVLSERAA